MVELFPTFDMGLNLGDELIDFFEIHKISGGHGRGGGLGEQEDDGAAS
jgi:hypothetical protein